MFYQLSVQETMKECRTESTGLTQEVAAERLEKNGRNEIPEGKRKKIPEVFLLQFADFLVIILITSAAVSFVLDNPGSAIVILCVITMNAILGTIQHFKAEKSLAGLRQLSAPSARVLRNGIVNEIPAAEVVTGDFLLIEAGNIVVADGRLMEAASLNVNESSLTGESTSVEKIRTTLEEKELPLADRLNMVYSGSLVTKGRGIAIVTATGLNTEIGKIASMIGAAKRRKTPLQVSLDQFGRTLSVLILIICALVMTLSLLRDGSLIDSLLFAVALAVAAIPEALSSIVTISLALGTQKMAKQNAIMKDLTAVEALGSVSVICSDKTGTLTQNKMTVTSLYCCNKVMEPVVLQTDHKILGLMKSAMILCNDSNLCITDNDAVTIGEPTEAALFNCFSPKEVSSFRKQYRRISELPFDSAKKTMSTLNQMSGGLMMFTKGAPDVLMPKLNRIQDENGLRCLTDHDIQTIQTICKDYADLGKRVLCICYKDMNSVFPQFAPSDINETVQDKASDCSLTQEMEQNLVFLGLLALTDPPRPESMAAVDDCKHAGIKTVMITGDHKATAVAIAKEIGIYCDGDIALNGMELDTMSDETLSEKLEHISVYARVAPSHKIRIVDLWQKKGNIVAMTGDGVNDAPALKKADIGVAMGITGTQVSQQAASMILTDDNFATIVKAVEGGRSIYQNIRNSILFLVSGNLAAIVTVLYASLLALPVPFSAVQLLFINLLTDSLPAIAISMEPAHGSIMKEPPRKHTEKLLNKKALTSIGTSGLLLSVSVITSYRIGLKTDAVTACTMAFLTLCAGRLFATVNFRCKQSLLHLGFFKNPLALIAFGTGLVLLLAVILASPLYSVFYLTALTPELIGLNFALAATPTLLIQLVRILRVR